MYNTIIRKHICFNLVVENMMKRGRKIAIKKENIESRRGK